jgi:hypothetical protein
VSLALLHNGICRCDPSVGPIGGLKSCQEKVTAEKHIDSTEHL